MGQQNSKNIVNIAERCRKEAENLGYSDKIQKACFMMGLLHALGYTTEEDGTIKSNGLEYLEALNANHDAVNAILRFNAESKDNITVFDKVLSSLYEEGKDSDTVVDIRVSLASMQKKHGLLSSKYANLEKTFLNAGFIDSTDCNNWAVKYQPNSLESCFLANSVLTSFYNAISNKEKVIVLQGHFGISLHIVADLLKSKIEDSVVLQASRFMCRDVLSDYPEGTTIIVKDFTSMLSTGYIIKSEYKSVDRFRVLKKVAELEHLDISDEVLEFLASADVSRDASIDSLQRYVSKVGGVTNG